MNDMRSLRVSVPDQSWVEALADLRDVETVIWDMRSPQPDGYLDYVLRPLGVGATSIRLLDTGRVGAVQGQGLGFDDIVGVLPPGGVFCNAVGVHEGPTAEIAMALMLASQRSIDVFARQQTTSDWITGVTRSMIGQRVLLLGYGGVNTEVEKRLSGFECEIVRVASRRREDAQGVIHGSDELLALLPSADIVVVAVPYSAATDRLLDDSFFAVLADDTLVVNVARGKVADTDAVVRQSGRVRYATDVTDPEPLPADHPLWSVPGVLISPHVGGMVATLRPRVERLVRSQIARLQAGEELAHIAHRA